jgi:hypothetical protein
MLHAPNIALEPVVDSLRNTIPDRAGRMSVVLEWFGHSSGDCPVCWMLTGKLVYTFDEPIALLSELVVASDEPSLISGAGLFVSTHLEPRHALPAGVSRERLAELEAELQALPEQVRRALGLQSE